MDQVLREDVLRIYAEADRDVAAAGPVCQVSGRCCRFKEYGHVLFLSSIEADLLLTSTPDHTQPVEPDRCPYQVNNLCTAREPRPLGCRVYFCDPSYQDTGSRISEKYVRRLKELCAEKGIAWHYAPLHHFLDSFSKNGDRQTEAARPTIDHVEKESDNDQV